MSANKDSIAYNTFPIIVENRKELLKKLKHKKSNMLVIIQSQSTNNQ